MRRKILLIEPPFYRLFKDTYLLCRYPLSLGYLSGMIKKFTRWDVVTYNADFDINRKAEEGRVSYFSGPGFYRYMHIIKDASNAIWQEIASVIADYKPDVVGISAKTQNFASAKMVAHIAKTINEKTVVVMGGVHPTLVGAKALECLDIDIGVKGEAEQTIIELLTVLEEQREVESVSGIVYRKEGNIIENRPREHIQDLDSLPFPHEYAHQTLKDYQAYPKEAFGSIFATRGCPYNCFFCGSKQLWGQKVRFRSPENVTKEIVSLQKKGLRFIHFEDDTFGVKKQYINDLCRAIMRDCPGVSWSCEMHVSLVDEETISLMKQAGCFKIQLGIESGNNEILKKVRKGITVEHALRACRVVKKYHIDLQTFFIFGFPWDTRRTMRDTVKAMRKTRSNYLVYNIFTPYPGTEAFEFCKQKGLIKNDYDDALYFHQSPMNHFCLGMSYKRLRKFLSNIEGMVDRINYGKLTFWERMLVVFSADKLKKIYRLGFGDSLKKALRILCKGK